MYRIEIEDGQVIEGTTDEQGLTQVVQSALAFAKYTVKVLDDE